MHVSEFPPKALSLHLPNLKSNHNCLKMHIYNVMGYSVIITIIILIITKNNTISQVYCKE